MYNPTISDKGLLEPIVMKVTRWVLRREGGGDSSDLSHGWFNCGHVKKGEKNNFFYLYFLRNIAAIMAVAITEITLAIIGVNLKPSGDCRIYPNAIKVHTIAGMNVMK